jgi:hypothetical protein
MSTTDYERAKLRLQAFALLDGWGFTNENGEHVKLTLEKRKLRACELVEWALERPQNDHTN